MFGSQSSCMGVFTCREVFSWYIFKVSPAIYIQHRKCHHVIRYLVSILLPHLILSRIFCKFLSLSHCTFLYVVRLVSFAITLRRQEPFVCEGRDQIASDSRWPYTFKVTFLSLWRALLRCFQLQKALQSDNIFLLTSKVLVILQCRDSFEYMRYWSPVASIET